MIITFRATEEEKKIIDELKGILGEKTATKTVVKCLRYCYAQKEQLKVLK